MGSHEPCIVPLVEAAGAGDGLVGGKAARLGSIIQAGFRVPRGFCITTRAYEQFVAEASLGGHIAMELGRKPLDAMRWEELWDAALLYRRELSLDPHRSRMAVLVQAVEAAECSGVAFNRDPRSPDAYRAVIEAVPGPCALLVDGTVDPDRWILERT